MWFLFGLCLGWAALANGRLVWPRLSALLKPEDWAALRLLLLLIAIALSICMTLATDRGTLSSGVLVLRSFFLTTHFELLVIGLALGALFSPYLEAIRRALCDGFSKPAQANEEPDHPSVSPVMADGADAASSAFRGAIAVVINEQPKKASDPSAKADESNTKSWALPVATVFVVVVLLIVVRPEFFSYVRSFKFAGVEATFSERAAAVIKEADLHVEDLREAETLEAYKEFYRNYIHPESPRGLARTLFGPKDIEAESGPIAELLMIGYFRPVIASINCLNEEHELGSVAQDPHLASFVYALRHILLNIHGTGTVTETRKLEVPDGDRKKRIRKYLKRLRESGLEVARRARNVAESCVLKDQAPWKGKLADPLQQYNVSLATFLDNHTAPLKYSLQQYNVSLTTSLDSHSFPDEDEIKRDADFIDKHYEKAYAALKSKDNDKPAIVSLMAMDAYLVGATADLIALLSGQKEKAIFLTNMLDQFPHSDDFITPGIVNIFYQLSDARVRTLSSWSLQQTLADLDYSLHGVDVLLAKSAGWLNARRELQPPVKRCLKDPNEYVEEDTKIAPGEQLSAEEIAKRVEIRREIRRVWCIHDTYLRNTILGLTTKLQLFNAMELSNRSISGTFHQEWRDSLGRMTTLLNTRLGAAIVLPASIPAAPLDARKGAMLPSLGDTRPDMFVEADLATALSVILISGRENPPDALSCNLSLFLLNDAARNARAVNDQVELKDAARETRWRQLVSVHSQQVGRSCGLSERSNGAARTKAAQAGTD